MDQRLDAEAAQLGHDIGHPTVAEIRDVLLERETEHTDTGALHRPFGGDKHLHEPLCDEGAHAVVDAAPGEDDVGMIAHSLRFGGEVVWVDPDAMAADEPGR